MPVELEHIAIPDFPGIPTVFSHAVKYPSSAALVTCSGQIHAEVRGENLNALAGNTITEKATIILEGLDKVLKAGGSSLGQLIKVNIYITDFAYFAELNEVYKKMVPDPKPARTCVCVKALPQGADIEIECTGWAES